MLTLPVELQSNNIVSKWEAAGRPGIDNWLKELKSRRSYRTVTKAKLVHALRAGISKLGYKSITEYREHLPQTSEQVLPLKFGGKEYSIPLISGESAPSFKETETGAILSSDSDTIKNQDDLVKACKIDTTKWEIERCEVKSYQGYRKSKNMDVTYNDGKADGYIIDKGDVKIVTMYAVKVWLSPRKEKPFEEVLDSILDRFREQPKVKSVKANYAKGSSLFIPAIFDVHFGRRDITNTYSPTRTREEFELATMALLGRAANSGVSIDRIMIPVGNDVLNADHLSGKTTRGTLQEMSSDIREAIDAACQSYISLTEYCLEIAPTDLVIVESNHDRLGMFWLGKVLQAWFEKHKYAKYVTIDNKPYPRKYYHYGVNLIGMEHGDSVKAQNLALIMAAEAPKIWGETVYRTFFRGHFHTDKTMYQAISEEKGVSVETFPAFCPVDMWEVLMGYIGHNRKAEGRFYHKENGPAGMFPIFIDELEK